MKRCVIIGGGEIKNLQYVRNLIQSDDFVIAADRGYEYCRKMGISPNLLLGDFDSYDGEFLDDCPILKFPVEKDDTDTMLAIKAAIEKGFENLLLFGMCGGRFDHSFANIQSIVFAAKNNVRASIADEDLFITAIKGQDEITVPYQKDFVLSVFAYSERCEGICLKNLFYPLENGVLENSFPLGVSNHFIDGKDAVISIKSGIALVICTREV